MKCLVTGGAGFIGAHVVRELIAGGHKVLVLDDLSGGFQANVPEAAEFQLGSILDYGLVNNLFEKHRFDYVYHLAAYAAEGLSHFIQRFTYQNNLIGSVNLINASVNCGVQCFVFTSSIAVYGAGQLPMHEAMTPMPEDPYGISKYAVEQQLKCTHRMMGLDYVIFRPHNVFGEYQNIGDPYRNVIGIFMNQIMTGEPLTIFGDGTQSRAFSYVGPVAKAIAVSPTIPAALGEVFNVGADRPYTVNELAHEVCQAFGVAPNIRYLDARHEVLHAYSDHSKAREVFGTKDDVDLATGLAWMAKWAKEVGPRTTRPFADLEIMKNLPASWKALCK